MHITNSPYNYDPTKWQTEVISSNYVLTNNFFIDAWIAIRILFGGNIVNYTKLVEKARKKATQDLIVQAEEKKAAHLINLKYESASLHPGTIEVLVYGTILIPKN